MWFWLKIEQVDPYTKLDGVTVTAIVRVAADTVTVVGAEVADAYVVPALIDAVTTHVPLDAVAVRVEPLTEQAVEAPTL